ncbi:molybdopterin-synthase adenylyltransferase MoeB [Enemella sp. A6]|uniref:molybdopterin-synthase adenylyltransferase MoeB n=1 Tax=Enemella sp. A6 TaxID=3440152 RepID=UPI003EC0BA6D
MAHQPLVPLGPALTPEEQRRYARHLTLPEVGSDGQRRLRGASVLVLGAGGLGSPVLTYLAAAGVGRVAVVDDDVVSESNLQRQVVHRSADLGRPKVESAAETLTALNPGVQIVTHRVPLSSANADSLLAGHHLVIDGSDNFTARYDLADAAVRAGIPHIWASVNRFEGQVSVLWAGRGPCYRCLFPQPPAPGAVPSCAEAGVLGAVPGVLGSIQAVEAVKLVCGVGEPLVGRIQLLDLLRGTVSQIRVAPDPTCVSCGEGASRVPAAEGWTPTALRQRLERGDVVVVDVREAEERAVGEIAGSIWMPKDDLLAGRWQELPTDRDVVLYCRSGVRSGECLAKLRAEGYPRADHLAGGIRAWIVEIDPTLRA